MRSSSVSWACAQFGCARRPFRGSGLSQTLCSTGGVSPWSAVLEGEALVAVFFRCPVCQGLPSGSPLAGPLGVRPAVVLGQRSHSRGRLGLTVGRLVGAGVWGDEAGGDRVGAEIGDGCMSPWVRRTGMIAAVVTDGCLPVTNPSVDSWSVSAST